ncbi:hypothetical protein [Rickettsiales endosymbiont of Peranema trichophorum]|nr:hypothetical protein [Rickettsiales endosymbiont of Peranema trichophorum]
MTKESSGNCKREEYGSDKRGSGSGKGSAGMVEEMCMVSLTT